jgi:hypothetical protein
LSCLNALTLTLNPLCKLKSNLLGVISGTHSNGKGKRGTEIEREGMREGKTRERRWRKGAVVDWGEWVEGTWKSDRLRMRGKEEERGHFTKSG